MNVRRARDTFHLHGHAFYVVGQGYLPATNSTMATFLDLDKQGKILRNFTAPPHRDGVIVNFGGYAIIRFVADNPGFWLFHCHMTFHFETGMGLIVHVGEPKDLPPIPQNFPMCGDFVDSSSGHFGVNPIWQKHTSKGYGGNEGNSWKKGGNGWKEENN